MVARIVAATAFAAPEFLFGERGGPELALDPRVDFVCGFFEIFEIMLGAEDQFVKVGRVAGAKGVLVVVDDVDSLFGELHEHGEPVKVEIVVHADQFWTIIPIPINLIQNIRQLIKIRCNLLHIQFRLDSPNRVQLIPQLHSPQLIPLFLRILKKIPCILRIPVTFPLLVPNFCHPMQCRKAKNDSAASFLTHLVNFIPAGHAEAAIAESDAVRIVFGEGWAVLGNVADVVVDHVLEGATNS